MSKPSVYAFLQASAIAYGESRPDGFENSDADSALASTNALMFDAKAVATDEGRPGWVPIDVQYTPEDGFYGVAFKTSDNNIIIAFEGTVIGSTQYDKRSLTVEDIALYNQEIPKALYDAAAFARAVLDDANTRGIPQDDVYATGHSLGGTEAEYVGLNLNISEVSFAGTGVPGYNIAFTSPPVEGPFYPNYPYYAQGVNYVDYGDPIGNFASNMPLGTGDEGFAPMQNMAHADAVKMIGSSSNTISFANSTLFAAPTALFGLFFQGRHGLSTYANDLGYTLPDYQQNSLETARDILESMELSLADVGSVDLSTARFPSDTIAASDDFRIVINSNLENMRVTQKSDFDLGGMVSDAGVNIVSFDPTTQEVTSEKFTDADNGKIYQYVASSSDAPISLSSNVRFVRDNDDTIFIGDGGFTGRVLAFGVNDTIDIVGVYRLESFSPYASPLQSDNVLSLPGFQLAIGSPYGFADDSFAFTSDGNGGTNININLLQDGDFYQAKNTGQIDALPYWTQIGSPGYLADIGNYQDYDSWLCYYGSTGSGLTQNVSTLSGNSYTLTFAVGSLSGSNGSSALRVIVDGVSTDYNIVGSKDSSFSFYNLQTETLNFVAISNSTAVSFFQIGETGGASALYSDISLVKDNR